MYRYRDIDVMWTCKSYSTVRLIAVRLLIGGGTLISNTFGVDGRTSNYPQRCFIKSLNRMPIVPVVDVGKEGRTLIGL